MTYRCIRCHTMVSRPDASVGYFAYCLTHDEDLYEFETYLDYDVCGY
jgi:hypothetical protein